MAKRNFSSAIEQSLQGRLDQKEGQEHTTGASEGTLLSLEEKVNLKKEQEEIETESQNEVENPVEENPDTTDNPDTREKASSKPKQAPKTKDTGKTAPHPPKSENKAKFELKTKIASKKTNHSFYIKDINYERLTKLAKDTNLSISEVLDEILTQVL